MTTLQRYFVSEENWYDDGVMLTDDFHHIIRVMRYQIDDMITCVHPNKQIALCKIINIDEEKQIVHTSIIDWLHDDVELPVEVTILQSLPKGNKLELIIQKGTELGATRFILFQSERSIVKWDERKTNNRLQRYRKIAKEASEQSKRNVIPTVDYVANINEFLNEYTHKNVLKLIAYEEEAKENKAPSLTKQLSKLNEGETLAICIGPEGGFSTNEISFFKKNGFSPVRLGKRILRTETASLYALAAISYHFEELIRE